MAHSAQDDPAGPAVLRGHIAGVGTAQGTRLVVGRWLDTPLGPFADVMVERADGARLLLAPRRDVVALITRLYTFDEIHLVDVRVVPDERSRTWTVTAGPLDARLTLGARTGVGTLLRMLPDGVLDAPGAAEVVDVVARVALPGVRTRGRGTDGSPEVYGARDQHAVVALDARWGAASLGPLRDVRPAVRFGFSSVPATPAVTAVRVRIGAPR
ncbi:hypothetical protein [Cellulomonas sp. S1-8]|uniref:hypothetical protein n=1 Tax=Cellulomonas sp. S1-8 TaxID=2904790 RepID=UPI002243A052|nr:hypothetical protein [Cellulomonas sp. S1-8]UZN05137.1 hypothetical protein OKX07_09705 [Cellulomonas sp. S1-8]